MRCSNTPINYRRYSTAFQLMTNELSILYKQNPSLSKLKILKDEWDQIYKISLSNPGVAMSFPRATEYLFVQLSEIFNTGWVFKNEDKYDFLNIKTDEKSDGKIALGKHLSNSKSSRVYMLAHTRPKEGSIRGIIIEDGYKLRKEAEIYPFIKFLKIPESKLVNQKTNKRKHDINIHFNYKKNEFNPAYNDCFVSLYDFII